MSVLPILQLGAAELRRPAVEVVRFDAGLARLLDDLVETMHAANGMGLAANQVGRPERVAIIEFEGILHELVNPRVHRLDGLAMDHEGCLSVAGFAAPLVRADRAVVDARDRTGRRVRIRGRGYFARALQHETDHLDGRLYVDRLPSLDVLERVPPVARRTRAASGGSSGSVRSRR